MEEKAYKTMGGAGATNIVTGICAIVFGLTAGILLLIAGSKLLADRSHLTI